MSSAIAGPVSFGLIPGDHWFQPDWIDEEKAAAGRAQMAADGVVYGGACILRVLVTVHAIIHPSIHHPGLYQYADTPA